MVLKNCICLASETIRGFLVSETDKYSHLNKKLKKANKYTNTNKNTKGKHPNLCLSNLWMLSVVKQQTGAEL
jgi:hypothetical protein